MLDITLCMHFPSTIYSSNQTGPLYYLQGDPLTIKLHKPDMGLFCLSEAVSLAMRSQKPQQLPNVKIIRLNLAYDSAYNFLD